MFYCPYCPTKSRVDFTSPCWLCLILTSKSTGQLLSILQTKTLSSHSRNGIKPQQNQCLQGGERKTLKNPNPSLSKPVKLQQEESPTLPEQTKAKDTRKQSNSWESYCKQEPAYTQGTAKEQLILGKMSKPQCCC